MSDVYVTVDNQQVIETVVETQQLVGSTVVGEQGPPGAGFTGSTGFTGSRGDTGFVGSQGDLGYSGSQGPIGFTGSQGDTGFVGSQGDIGYTGSQGPIGFTGSRGETGFVGSQGDLGYSGSQGPIGYTGSQGIQGVIGYTGSQGPIGYTGSQGPIGYTGSKGEQGTFGGAAFDYTFDTDTTDSDPTDGYLRFNNVALGSATQLYIHDNDDNSVSIFNYLQTIDDSTSSIKGHFTITEKTNPNNYAMFAIVGSHTHATSYFKVPVSWLSGATSFTDNLDIIITFARTGDRGDTGYVGSQGDIGYTGSQGVGFTGSQGDIGYTGSQGPIGYTGSIGDIDGGTY